tara:strand:- start:245 stop:835 length:591 start_codon:yes stop_codon:yes gene_type:complete
MTGSTLNFVRAAASVLLLSLGACSLDRDRVAAVTEPAQDGAGVGVVAGVLAGGVAAAVGVGGSAIGSVLTGAQVGAVGGAGYGVWRASGQGHRVLGPDNWLAFDALGRCRLDKAVRLARPQLVSADPRYRDGARMLLAIAYRESGDDVGADAMLQAMTAEPGRDLTQEQARADVDQLLRSLQRQRRSEGYSLTCTP